MGKIIAITNQKGGVGKTTTAINLAASLHFRGKAVLLVDCDPQCNATTGMGIDKSKVKSLYDVMFRDYPIGEAMLETKHGSVICSHADLAGANVELVDLERREYLLKSKLDPVRDRFEYILLDCPPSLELLTLNALTAADRVMVPVQSEFYALEGLSDLMNTVRLVKQRLNPEMELEGLLLTMYDGRTRLARDVEKALRGHFPGKVYQTVIPRSIRLSEAPSHGMPCIEYDRMCRGTRAYLHLTDEFLKIQEAERQKAEEERLERERQEAEEAARREAEEQARLAEEARLREAEEARKREEARKQQEAERREQARQQKAKKKKGKQRRKAEPEPQPSEPEQAEPDPEAEARRLERERRLEEERRQEEELRRELERREEERRREEARRQEQERARELERQRKEEEARREASHREEKARLLELSEAQKQAERETEPGLLGFLGIRKKKKDKPVPPEGEGTQTQ
ncbi:MAG: AAA family ATPase [Oscillospiraceae bacterium]|nr:AAA family ATPase [Oscillospiraceae bacterium]